jgi:hypothetical protein
MKAMSRSRARPKVTSSPPRRISPEVGSSRPAIMRKVVVLPQPEGPRSTKKLPSSMVRLLSRTGTKSPDDLCRLVSRIWVMCARSGKWLTTMNITVPARITGKLQVNSGIARGCISMTMPTPITAGATFSQGPRRRRRWFICAPRRR